MLTEPATVASLAGTNLLSNILGTVGSYLSARELNKALDKMFKQTESTYGYLRSLYEPYYTTGRALYDELIGNIRSGAYDVPAYEYKAPIYKEEQFVFDKSPGYDWRLKEGQRAIETSAAARGTGLSGATLKALQRYGQEYAANEFMNAWNRFLQNRAYKRGIYESDRAFESNDALRRYEIARQRALDKYKILSDITSSALSTGLGGLTSTASSRGDTINDLLAQRGNISAMMTTIPFSGARQITRPIDMYLLYNLMRQ